MTTVELRNDIASKNERSLKTLLRAITMSQGQFALILVRCNYHSLRQQILTELTQSDSLSMPEILLKDSLDNLASTIYAGFTSDIAKVVMVTRLEIEQTQKQSSKFPTHTEAPHPLAIINQQRDQLRKHLPFPLVLWLNDDALQQFVRFAPDFYSWAAPPIEFERSVEDLTQLLQQRSDRIFNLVLNPKISSSVQDMLIDFKSNQEERLELELAMRELWDQETANQPSATNISADLAASWDFIWGRDFWYFHNNMDTAKDYFERSLSFWQQTNNLLRQGVILFYLGQWWLKYIKPDGLKTQQQSFLKAKNYFEQCLAAFEKAERTDLVAKFIHDLCSVLLQLQQWHQLEILAKRAMSLHYTYNSAIAIAQDYGFLAEVDLRTENWHSGKFHATSAIQIITHPTTATKQLSFAMDMVDTPEQRQEVTQFIQQKYECSHGYYQFLLAKTQWHLGQQGHAETTLQEALAKVDRNYNPQLYIHILKFLRSIYFDQGKYLAAFRIKQKQRSIEQQYGFRAFIGAGKLQPRRQSVEVSRSLSSSKQSEVATEIKVSGRSFDIERLVERLTSSNYKLTIVHGESGVGKSSLLNAGLIPALSERIVTGREILPIVLRVYTNWATTIWQALQTGTLVHFPSLVNEEESLKILVNQLRQSSDRYFLVILIFDQFEEFFFTCRDPIQRQSFFNFMQACLHIPFVKLVFSIREDYLHLLLSWESRGWQRNRDLDESRSVALATSWELPTISNELDILSRDMRYPLGNLSSEDALSVIVALTCQSQFSLELELVQELVRDLAADLGCVRPIELQLVGAQLQSENITTLEQYRVKGPKQKLVERSLEAIIKDCGINAETTAKQVLYALTDENGTRPLKTYNDLIAELDIAKSEHLVDLDMVLEILVDSGLVFLLPEFPVNRYQLVHDYLVPFIRSLEESGLKAKLVEMRATEARSQSLIKRMYTSALVGAGVTLIILCGLAWQAHQQRQLAEVREIKALASNSESLFLLNKQLESLIASIKAGNKLKHLPSARNDREAYAKTLDAIQKSVFDIQEFNRIEKSNTPIYTAQFSPDGKYIASAGWLTNIKLWQTDGKKVREFNIDKETEIRSIVFSPNSQLLAAVGKDGLLRIWSINHSNPILTFQAHNAAILGVSFSPDGKAIATASADHSVKVWQIPTPHALSPTLPLLLTLQGHTDFVYDVSFSPDGKAIATASADRTIKLWDFDSKLLTTLRGHTDAVSRVRFSPDGKILASASWDNSVKLWNFQGAETRLNRTTSPHKEQIYGLSFSHDGKAIVTASRDKTIKVIRLSDNAVTANFAGHEDFVFDVSFSPNDQEIVSASKDQTVRLWRTNSPLLQTLSGHKDNVWAVKFSPDGKNLISSSADGTLKLWDITGKLVRDFQGDRVFIYSVNFSPDSKIIVSGSNETVKLWQKEDGKLLRTFTGHTGLVNSVGFSPDGQTIASASWDRTVKLWHINGTLLRTLIGHQDKVWAVSFSPIDSNLVTASEDGTLKLWQMDGKLIKTIADHRKGVLTVSYSPDGQKIASAGKDGYLKIWDQNGNFLRDIKTGDKWIYGLSFSHDGQTIASASADRTIKLWNTEDGTLLKTLIGHDGEVVAVNFSPELSANRSARDQREKLHSGNRTSIIASASRDSTIKLWKAETLDLDNLLVRGCRWLDNYLKYGADLSNEDRQVCKDIL